MTGTGHNHGDEARRFVRSQQSGVLSTLSKRIEGFPFGSVAPFVLDHAGCPVILISTLAEHTKNLDADPRCSLIVQPYSPDMQVVGRTTVIGNATRLDDKNALGPRYLRYHPQAEAYFAMHDFHFYRIEPVRIRWIGGFGKIHWVEPGNYLLDEYALAGQETDILAHMNGDHGPKEPRNNNSNNLAALTGALRRCLSLAGNGHAARQAPCIASRQHTHICPTYYFSAPNLTDYCRHVHGVESQAAEMIGIDPDGFDVRAEGRILRFDFPSRVTDAQQARSALVALAQSAKTPYTVL